MKTSPKGLAEIAAHEGIVQMPYRDSVGVWTFGVGHTKWAGSPDPAKMPKGVAQPMGDVAALFAKDIAKYEAGVNKALKGKKVKQHEYDAAVSFHYNTGGIARASWVKYWLQGNKKEAAQLMGIAYHDTVSKGWPTTSADRVFANISDKSPENLSAKPPATASTRSGDSAQACDTGDISRVL